MAGVAAQKYRQDQIDKPSIAYWRDHSAGASRRRVTPIPRGSRPWMAAFTSSGARKASEIVILTCRMLHLSRAAICSTPMTVSSPLLALEISEPGRPTANQCVCRAGRSVLPPEKPPSPYLARSRVHPAHARRGRRNLCRSASSSHARRRPRKDDGAGVASTRRGARLTRVRCQAGRHLRLVPRATLQCCRTRGVGGSRRDILMSARAAVASRRRADGNPARHPAPLFG
jgi:hypothetical protein